MAHAQSIILLVFLSMLLSVLCIKLRKITKIPTSVLIFIVGTIYSLAGQHIPKIDETVDIMKGLDFHSIMFIFLPALIYEASTKIDWFTFKNELPQIIPLASTVVLVSSFLNALVIKQIILPSFSFSEALLLGVILSATDHVAVCAQLREAHAHKRLETLILGETLLNEVVIILFFNLIWDGLEREYKAEDYYFVALNFFRLSLGGCLLGFICAVILGYYLISIINDSIQEISLILSVVYLTYYIADGTPVHVSGAIAVVTIGLYMAAYGKTLISHSCEHTYHEFWKIIGFNTEAIVFIIAGVFLEETFSNSPESRLEDLGYSVILFFLLYVTRGLALMIHFPWLRYVGYRVNLKEIVFLTLSGTKGAVSLALALTAYREEDNLFSNNNVNNDILFYSSTVAALTIVFGTFIVKCSVNLLDLKSLTDVKENMIGNIALSISRKTEDKIEEMKKQREFLATNWYKVYQIAGPSKLAYHIVQKTKFARDLPIRERTTSISVLLDQFTVGSGMNNYQEMKRRYLGALKEAYWHLCESGRCLDESVVILINSVNLALDNQDNLEDWEFVKKEVFQSKNSKFLFCMAKIPLLGKIFLRRIYSRLSISYDLCRAFIDAHTEALEVMKNTGLFENEEFKEKIEEEVEAQINQCNEYQRRYIYEKYPHIVESVITNMTCHMLLKFQMNIITDLHSHGLLEELEFEQLKDSLDASLKLLSYNQHPEIPDLKYLLRQRFPNLTNRQLKTFSKKISERNIGPEETIFSEGSEVSDAFLILQGGVEEYSQWINQELGVGNIVGVQNLILNSDRNTTTAKTLNVVRVATLTKDLLQDESMMEELYREASEEILLFYSQEFELDCRREFIYKMCRECTIQRIDKDDRIHNRHGFFVLMGKVGDTEEHRFQFPDDSIHVAECESIVMILNEKLGQIISRYGSISSGIKEYYRRRTGK